MQGAVTGVSLLDWQTWTRLDYAGTGAPGFQVFGRVDLSAGVLWLALRTDGMPIGAHTTIWLNTDRDTTTGYQIWGRYGGAEFNVDFKSEPDGSARPYLHRGGAGERRASEAPLPHAFTAGRSICTLAIPLALIEVDRNSNPTGAMDLLIDINDTVFLPVDYSGFTYTVYDPTTLPLADGERRATAIVFSETSAARYFDPVAYSDLLDEIHLALANRGVVLSILAESDLLDLDRLAPFGTLLFPAFQNVPRESVRAVAENLHLLSYHCGTRLIVAGNFMTNDEAGTPLPGDPYARMRSLLNVMRTGGANDVEVTLCAEPQPRRLLPGLCLAGTIKTYPTIATQFFGTIDTNFDDTERLAVQIVDGQRHDAIIATRTGGLNLFCCTDAFLAASPVLDLIAEFVLGTSNEKTSHRGSRPSDRGGAGGASFNDAPFSIAAR